ncbi:MAG: BLUF domain-containing protein [Pseudomonadota bacterium]
MLDDKTAGSPSGPARGRKRQTERGDLIALAYRSTPTSTFSTSDLNDLLKQARENNGRLKITGTIIVAKAQIFQWLEGPREAVEALMDRISSDPRHCDIEILERGEISERLFGPWTMLLATDGEGRPGLPGDALTLSGDSIVEALEGKPSQESLRAVADEAQLATASGLLDPPDNNIVFESLRPFRAPAASFETQLRARLEEQAKTSNREKWDLAASALTTLLLENDFSRVEHFLRSMSRREVDPLPLQVALLEQSERRLGDLWLDNLCSDLEINSALSDMIRALRSVNFGTLPVWRVSGGAPDVLVVSQPGELHMLSAVLDAEVLWQHGWSPTLEFPKRDKDLQQMLSDHWYEALDISMSGVFKRPEKLDGLAQTVELARDASANQNIAITVGGRAVYEDRSLLIQVGADAVVASARDVETAIHDAIELQKQ